MDMDYFLIGWALISGSLVMMMALCNGSCPLTCRLFNKGCPDTNDVSQPD